jgi:hypothetical protein
MTTATAATGAQDAYKYWAFISYSHRDRASDDWLLRSARTARSIAFQPGPYAVAAKAQAAVEALRPLGIRHGVDDFPLEQASFGTRDDWPIDVPHARPWRNTLRYCAYAVAPCAWART